VPPGRPLLTNEREICYPFSSAEGMTFAGNVMLDKATD